MRLYFIRHGQTDYNLKQIVQGGGIDSDLNPTGHQQAHAFFEAYQDRPFSALYASPLKRTHQTLAPWQRTGHSIRTEIGLKEFNWGTYEGKRPTLEEHNHYKEVLAQWAAGEEDARVAEGETLREAWERAQPFFETLYQKHTQEEVLLCSHGRQLRILLCKILDLPYQEMERFSHDNTGLTIVEYNPSGKAELLLLNDTQHLDTTFA